MTRRIPEREPQHSFVRVYPEHMRALRHEATERNITQQDIVAQALDEYFARRSGKEIPPSPFGKLTSEEEGILRGFLSWMRDAGDQPLVQAIIQGVETWERSRAK